MQCLMSAASQETRPSSMFLACRLTRWISPVILRQLTSCQRTSLMRQSCRIRGETTGMTLHLLHHLLHPLCHPLHLRVSTNTLLLRLNAHLALLHLRRLLWLLLSHLLLLRLLLHLHAHLCAHRSTSRQRDTAASGHTLHWLANTSLRAPPASKVPSTTRSLSAAILCPSDSGLVLLPPAATPEPSERGGTPQRHSPSPDPLIDAPIEPEPTPAPASAPPAPPPSPASSDDELDLLAEGHEDVYECSLEAMLSGIEDVYCTQRDN
ncbi:hypothetical protein BV20DRAFT_1069689 [Pilatotrama ljubarskyi]|nr:hypothetical protein BV20DRAFT_1069689 [Pilatotrama ljubarskyi]